MYLRVMVSALWPLHGEADLRGDREQESDACSVPPAGCGAWVWELVGDEFDRLGIAHRAIDPPSLGSAPPADAGIRRGTAAVVRSVLDSLAGQWCSSATPMAASSSQLQPSITQQLPRLVYVAAFMPEPGVPVFEQLVTTDAFSSALSMTDDGVGSFDPDRAPAIVFHQAEPDVAERAAIRMQRRASQRHRACAARRCVGEDSFDLRREHRGPFDPT